MVFTVLAIFNPGTGVLEILALFVLFAAGVGVYSLATRELINWWSLLIALVGLVLLILAMSRPRQPTFLVASIVCIVIGSAYLVKGDPWYLPGVSGWIVLRLINPWPRLKTFGRRPSRLKDCGPLKKSRPVTSPPQ